MASFMFEKVHAHEFAQVPNDQFGVAVRGWAITARNRSTPTSASPPARGRVLSLASLEEVDRLIEGVLKVQRMFAPKGRQRKRRKPDE